MIHSKSTHLLSFTKCTTLALTILIGLLEQGYAQTPPGTLIGSGHVTGGPSVAIPDQSATVSLQYSLFVQPDGTPSGRATLTSEAGSVEFALTSYTVDPDGLLLAAGPATNVVGSPMFGPDSEGPTPHIVELGETLFFTVFDNQGLDGPDAFIEGKVPSFLPSEVIEQSRTIQDILPALPPTSLASIPAFRQVTDGDLSVSNSPGTLIASGNVAAVSNLPDQELGFALRFSLFVRPDGSPSGRATLTSEVGSVDFSLTSYRIGSDGRLAAAGPVDAVRGTPSFGPDAGSGHIVETGEIMFFAIRDNGDGNDPDSFIEGKVPFFLPIEENDTIQKIAAIIGEAPDSFFRQVGAGDLVKFPAKRAFAAAQLTNGTVSEIQVTDSGSGYDAEPVVIISGDGSGATAVVTLTNGVVTAITVTNPGNGYTNPPNVLVSSAPFDAELAIAVSKVRVSLKVVLGGTYQLESSHDLNTWVAAGDPFVAQAEELVEEFDVNKTGRFFRIQSLQ